MRALPSLLVLLVACGGGSEDTGGENPCGDIDGVGGDTGDVPSPGGLYTTRFGSDYFDESCNLGGLDRDALSHLRAVAEITGYVPDGLLLTLDRDEEHRYRGALTPGGGMMFAGQRPSQWGTLHEAIGGLLYTDPRLDRTVWKGAVYVGIDTDEDGSIDCDLRGDFGATMSGS